MNASPEQLERIEGILRPLRSLLPKNVTDVEIMADNITWVKDSTGKIESYGHTLSPDDLEALGYQLGAIFDQPLDTFNFVLECELPADGTRVTLITKPAVKETSVYLRFHSGVFLNIDELEARGFFQAKEDKARLIRLVKERKNIIISGETGSGKTTLLSALLAEADPMEHIVLIEDTREIICKAKRLDQVLVTGGMTPEKAVKTSLRMNPDRIIYGEVRDGAVLNLLKSWNTGHKGGLATIHANSAESVYSRICDMCLEVVKNVPEQTIRMALDCVVQIGFVNNKRKVVEIKEFNT